MPDNNKKNALERLRRAVGSDERLSVTKVTQDGDITPNFAAGELLRTLLRKKKNSDNK